MTAAAAAATSCILLVNMLLMESLILTDLKQWRMFGMRMKSSLLTVTNYLKAMAGELVVTNPEGPQRSKAVTVAHKTRHQKQNNALTNVVS